VNILTVLENILTGIKQPVLGMLAGAEPGFNYRGGE
jgi:hypothetical protein